MEFEIAVQNPCNTGNAVVFSDTERTEIGTLIIMSGWSTEIVDLPSVLTDKVTREGSLGSCGDLTFEMLDNKENGVEYTVVRLDQETKQLIVESNNPEDEGKYEFRLVASLPQYPGAIAYSEVITAEIRTVKMVNRGLAAWILLPILVVLFFVLGFALGTMYQRRKSGWHVNPCSPTEKITAAQADEDDTLYDAEVAPLGLGRSHEITNRSNDNLRRSQEQLGRSNDISQADLQKGIKKLNDRATTSKYVDPKWEKHPDHPDNLPRSSKGFRSTSTFTVRRPSIEENEEQPEV